MEFASMFGRMKKGGPYSITDVKDFSTCRFIFVITGCLYDGSLLSRIRMPIFFILMYSAPFHHTIVLFTDEKREGATIVIYLFMMYLHLWICYPCTLYYSKEVMRFWDKVRSGFFTYSEPFSDDEKIILSKANDTVVRSTKIALFAYIFAGVATYAEKLSPDMAEKLILPYPGWYPYEINSKFRFYLSLTYQLLLCANTSLALAGVFALFIYHMIHFECQLNVLKQHLYDTFPPGLSSSLTYSEEYKQRTIRRLQDCVKHHLIIKDIHKWILKFFGVGLFIFRVVSTTMLCILGYSVTMGISLKDFTQLFGFACVFLFLLFIFCIKGERATQLSETLQLTIYDVEWWNHPVEVQKMILLMLVGSGKPLEIYGIWKVAMFSHRGISAIGQESFSFFNMLRATK